MIGDAHAKLIDVLRKRFARDGKETQANVRDPVESTHAYTNTFSFCPHHVTTQSVRSSMGTSMVA